jgi:EmrB/QacA subfamily drug resistance transporter
MTDVATNTAVAVPVHATSPRRRPAAPAAKLRADNWLALPVLLAGTCLIVLDFFIVNVALPSMQAELGAGASALEWVVAGYALTSAVFLLAAGRVGDRIGRRRMFSLGVATFTVASLACGVAPTASVLVAARLVQGAAGAMISPSVLALIGVLYAGPARAKAISIYATVMGVAAAGGQLLGGALLSADLFGLGWRTVFLINVPVGALALAVVRRLVPESRAPQASAVDLTGLALATLGMTALVLPLVDGRSAGWPWWTWVSLAAAPVLFADFAWRQRVIARRGGAPLLDPALFRDRTFTIGMLTQLAFWGGQASYFLVLALYLQLGRGLSAMQSGLVFTILASAYLLASLRAPELVARWGRAVIVEGALALAVGHAIAFVVVADIGVAGHVLLLAPALLLVGAGMGLCLAPITATVLGSVDPHRAGAVSGALSTMQQVGNAVGVAVVGVVFFGAVARGYAHAFELSVATLAALLVGVACCARLLPGRPRA